MVTTVEGKSVEQVSIPSMADVSSVHSDFLRFRLDPSPLLRQMQRLIGAKEWVVVKDKDGRERGVWVQDPNRKPLANDQFISEVMTILTGYVNPNTMQGNISEEYAHRICECASEELIFLIAQRSDEYEILEINRDFIWNLIDDMVFLSLSRAIDDMQRFYDSQSFKSAQVSKGMTGSGEGKFIPKLFGG